MVFITHFGSDLYKRMGMAISCRKPTVADYSEDEPASYYSADSRSKMSISGLIRGNKKKAKSRHRKGTQGLCMDPFNHALERMHVLTTSQVTELAENCGLDVLDPNDRDSIIMSILVWREERDEFKTSDISEDFVTKDGISDDSYALLPLYMENVHESTLRFGLFKSDLQLECLIRCISYEGCDTKDLLIEKLMAFKNDTMSNQNSFDFLGQQSESCATPSKDTNIKL